MRLVQLTTGVVQMVLNITIRLLSAGVIYISQVKALNLLIFLVLPYSHLCAMGDNGDDAIELFCADDGNGMQVVDVFGDINTDGSGTAWDHLDGWYRKSFTNKSNNSTWTIGRFFQHE